MNRLIVHKELFVVILETILMKKKRENFFDKKMNKTSFYCRVLTTEHNSNSNESIDDIIENNSDKRPQYKNIMNNIRRGIRTDDDVTDKKRVCFEIYFTDRI